MTSDLHGVVGFDSGWTVMAIRSIDDGKTFAKLFFCPYSGGV